MSIHDDPRARAIEHLYHWQYGTHATNFTSQLYSLMQKADPQNRYKLSLGFPVEDQVLEEWMAAISPEKFFEDNGIGRPKGHIRELKAVDPSEGPTLADYMKEIKGDND